MYELLDPETKVQLFDSVFFLALLHHSSSFLSALSPRIVEIMSFRYCITVLHTRVDASRTRLMDSLAGQ